MTLAILFSLAMSYQLAKRHNNVVFQRINFLILTLLIFMYIEIQIEHKVFALLFVNMVFDAFLAVEWYKHLALLSMQLIVCDCPVNFAYLLIPEVFIYALFEYASKMNWVYRDTSK